MYIARMFNNGICPECGAKDSLELKPIIDGELKYGDVSCIKCYAWISDMPLDDMKEYGIKFEEL